MTDSTDGDSLDHLISEIGMGKYQILGLVTNFLVWFVLSPHTIGTTLLNAPVPFNCYETDQMHYKPIEREINGTSTFHYNINLDELHEESIIFDKKCFNNKQTTSYKNNITSGILLEISQLNSSLKTPIIQRGIPSCPYIHYDDEIFTSTVTTEFHLICDQSLHSTLFQNTYTLGTIIGCIIGGDIGDRLGRHKAIVFGSFVQALSTITVAFVTNYYVLLIARFFVGFTDMVLLVPVVTYALETCPGKYRGPVGMIVGLPYSLGMIVFAGIGYFIRNWRYLYMATSFPALLLCPISCLLDESPRWLVRARRTDDAERVLLKMIKRNNAKISEKKVKEAVDFVAKEIENENIKPAQKPSEKPKNTRQRFIIWIKEAFKILDAHAMRIVLFAPPFIWLLNECLYYGTIFNANNFSSSNPFIYVGLTGVADAVGVLIGAPACTFLGRRITVGGSILISSVMTFLMLGVPDELKWLQWIFVMAGFLMCAVGSQALFVFTPELYPTTMRTRGFSFANLTGYIGILIAPYIPDVLSEYGWWVTPTILGLCGLTASALAWSLPETNNIPMCETVSHVIERHNEAKRKRRNVKSDTDEIIKKESDVENNKLQRECPITDNKKDNSEIDINTTKTGDLKQNNSNETKKEVNDSKIESNNIKVINNEKSGDVKNAFENIAFNVSEEYNTNKLNSSDV